jgi:hypothetical protein
MAKKSFSLSVLLLAGVIASLSMGCSTLIGLMNGTNKKTDAAAQTFVGKSVEELLSVGSPKYSQAAGKVESYAFYHWIVRQAAGEEGVKTPVAYGFGDLMVIFTCSDGVIKSYKLQADQEAYFKSWQQH